MILFSNANMRFLLAKELPVASVFKVEKFGLNKTYIIYLGGNGAAAVDLEQAQSIFFNSDSIQYFMSEYNRNGVPLTAQDLERLPSKITDIKAWIQHHEELRSKVLKEKYDRRFFFPLHTAASDYTWSRN